MKTIAAAIAAELHALGVTHFFLVTGADNALWIELHRRGIRQVMTRSEASAVYMADAYARLTGEPAFVYGQFGPGAANVAGALAEPYWAASPVVALCTAMRRQHRHRHEYQELEQLHLFTGVTRWQAEAQLPEQVPHLIRAGAARAMSSPGGPVYVGVPSDLLDEPLTPASQPELVRVRPSVPVADPEAVAEVARRLAVAERPVLLAGNGVHRGGGYAALTALAEALRLPVVTSLSGKGAIAETHELAFGTVGRYSRNYANDLLREADTLLAVGTSLGGLVTDSYRLISPDTTMLHVDSDPTILGHNYPAAAAVCADVGSFLARLHEVCAAGGPPPELRTKWVEELIDRRSSWQHRRRELAGREVTPGQALRPEAVLDVVNRTAPDDVLLVADTGYAAAWAGALFETRRSGRGFLRADGSLGWALPGALGAQLAVPGRPVVCITGDGGFGYHVGELETARRLGLPVVVVVLDNGCLALEDHVQRHLHGYVVPEVNEFCDVDYGHVARAFGVRGQRVHTAAEFEAAFRAALAAPAPTVLDVVVAKDAIGPVTRYDAVRDREL